MSKLIDLTGLVFGKLTVISFHGSNADKKSLWNCRCECGIIVIKSGKILRKGKELYCGNQHPTKVCTQCKMDKPKSDYHKCNANPIGISPVCKECQALFYIKNRGVFKKLYNESMKDTVKKKRKYEINQKSRIKNREQQRKQKLEYNRREYVMERRRNIHRARRENDIIYVIKRRLRWRIRDAVKRTIGKGYKYKSSLVLLGCDMEFFKQYIESKFSKGMNWGNISKWHIDHIKPCSKFDLTKLSEQMVCFHYSNLQPLWWRDNLIKGTTFEDFNSLKNP